MRVVALFFGLVCACGSSGSGPSDAGDAGDAGADTAGPTELTLLEASDAYPYGIAVDTDYVYYTASVAGTLSRIPKNGGAPEVLAGGMINPGRIAVDANAIYVVVRGTADAYVDGGILRVAKSDLTPTWLATSLHGAASIALDGDELYFANFGAFTGGSYQGDGTVCRVKADGSTPSETLLTSESYSVGIVVDDAHVYFTDRYVGTVVRCDKANCASTRTVLFDSLDEPIGIAITGTTLVFAEWHGGRILTGNTDGTNLATLQGSRGLPHDVLFAHDAYWLETLTREVNRQPLDPTIRFDTLTKTPQDPSCMAADDVYVYVTDEHDGEIIRVPR